jgi:hypothetical protein
MVVRMDERRKAPTKLTAPTKPDTLKPKPLAQQAMSKLGTVVDNQESQPHEPSQAVQSTRVLASHQTIDRRRLVLEIVKGI